MRKEKGVWVFDIGTPVTASDVRRTIRKIREERLRKLSGKKMRLTPRG